MKPRSEVSLCHSRHPLRAARATQPVGDPRIVDLVCASCLSRRVPPRERLRRIALRPRPARPHCDPPEWGVVRAGGTPGQRGSRRPKAGLSLETVIVIRERPQEVAGKGPSSTRSAASTTSSCSHTRTDRHPRAARRRSVSRSRSTLRWSLQSPPISVVDRSRCVLGAGMPEAPVDEHDHSRSREQDVRPSARHPWERSIDPETPAAGVQQPTQSDLRRGVTTTLSAHTCMHRHAPGFGHDDILTPPVCRTDASAPPAKLSDMPSPPRRSDSLVKRLTEVDELLPRSHRRTPGPRP